MLQAADVGYAVENAVPCVKAVADRITVDYRDHAIAAIVRDLEEDVRCGRL
jgi:hydroxymethylpyrimidine pyrophosphatase-like HAD family hydrolase